MSTDSLAAFRKSPSTDLQKLADEHLQHEYVYPLPPVLLPSSINLIPIKYIHLDIATAVT